MGKKERRKGRGKATTIRMSEFIVLTLARLTR